MAFDRLREAALTVRDALAGLDGLRQDYGLPRLSRVRAERTRSDAEGRLGLRETGRAGPRRVRPSFLTAEYRIAKRPPGRVLVDYNQNAWGRTLASIYSVRPHPRASSRRPSRATVARGVRLEEFHIGNVPGRVKELGDCGRPARRDEAGTPSARVSEPRGCRGGVIRIGIYGGRYGPWREVWYPDGRAQRCELSSARGTSRPWRSTARSTRFGPIPLLLAKRRSVGFRGEGSGSPSPPALSSECPIILSVDPVAPRCRYSDTPSEGTALKESLRRTSLLVHALHL